LAGAEDAGKDLLRMSAICGSVTAPYFASDDRRPDCLLATPVSVCA
jgi:hypothetical protein